MSKIFISHSSSDNAKALALAQWLEQHGWADYFLDITPSRGLSPGERWQAALKTATDRCEAVVFLISPAWRDSKWCLAEFLLAKQLGKTIFGVIVELTPIETLPKEMTAEWQLCVLVSGAEQQTFQVFRDQILLQTQVTLARAGLAGLKQGLQKAGLDPSVFPWPPPNEPERSPYRGLKALEAEDAAVFFGREASLIRALDTLRRMEASGEQLFVILGASGAGKSSFLRAGLWPRLTRDDRHFLPLPVVRPERAAISGQSGLLESLEKTFREYKVPKTRASLRATLEKSDGLIELLAEVQGLAQKRLGPEAIPPTIVIGIDQAEELFGKEGSDEAGHMLEFVGTLIRQAADGESRTAVRAPHVMVLAAIRSDSYERMQTAPALAGIRQTPFNLPPLAPAEYKMVIEGPAARATAAGHKLSIEPALTEQLLKDAEGADALPLLAFILERLLIDYGSDGDLLLTEYEALDGLQGSIEVVVNEAWKDPGREPAIPADEATRRVFLDKVFPALVMFDHEADKPNRRVATWSLLPRETYPLLERLVAARLLLKNRRTLADGQEAVIVEVAHEALIRHWGHLIEWVDTNREDLFVLRRAEIDAGEWERQGCDLKYLWHEDRLKKLQEIVARRGEKSVMETVRRFMRPQEKYFQRVHDTSLSHQERFTIGQSLATIGDRRFGVGLRADGLPDIEWVEILGGEVKLGKGDRVFDVTPFRIAKYPVTNAQFDAFLKAEDGYQNTKWWDKIEQSTEAFQPNWLEANSPREFVSWYEAVAFCRWLSAKTGTSIRLPVEWEWQQAAKGGDPQRKYPWEGGWDASRCNSADSGLHRTTAVGMYPQGATEQGVLDMAGNIWEWCLNTYEQLDTRITTGGRRVIRGGSWFYIWPEPLRTSLRYSNSADYRDNNIGFRLAQDLEP